MSKINFVLSFITSGPDQMWVFSILEGSVFQIILIFFVVATFQWTPDPPPKKKKSKKAGKKSLLTGFGPGAAHEDKSEDVSSVLTALMIDFFKYEKLNQGP